MKKKNKIIIGILLVLVIILVIVILPKGKPKDYSEKYIGETDLHKDIEGIGRDNTYAKYLERHSD